MPQPKYTPELGVQIVTRWINGESLTGLLKEPGMPHPLIWANWCAANPELAKLWEQARALKADIVAEEVLAISDDHGADPNRSRLQVETRKWYAGVHNRARYGAQVDVNVNGQINIRAALDAAFARTALPGCYQHGEEEPQLIDFIGVLPSETGNDQCIASVDRVFDDLL